MFGRKSTLSVSVSVSPSIFLTKPPLPSDGPYGNFAGHDATRGLAKGSFDDDMITPPDQPLDKLEDLTEEDWESLRDWEGLFESKYPIVGNLVNPPSSSMGSQA